MPKQSPLPNDHSAPRSATELDAVVDRLAALTEEGLAEDDFFEQLLREITQATGAYGAAVWKAEGESFRLICQCRLSFAESDPPGHGDVLRETLAAGQSRTVQDGSKPDGGLAILSPWRSTRQTAGVLELHQRGELSEGARAGQRRFVAVAADLIAIYYRNRQLDLLSRREDQWRGIDQFTQAVHRHDDLEAAAYEIANEGRRIIGCDRLTVVVRRRRRWETLAVSGADSANRRSALLAHLQRVAEAAAAQQQAVWCGQSGDELPPELEEPIDDYLDCSAAHLAGFIPLTPAPASAEQGEDDETSGEPFAVLVVECFESVDRARLDEPCAAVCRHSATALELLLKHERMPLHRLSRLLDKAGWVAGLRRRPKAQLALAAIAVGLLLLVIIPAPLRVEATGSLQPQAQYHLFAPADGVVEQLMVQTAGQSVDRDEELIRLRSRELQYETERLRGELETARKRLAAVEAERAGADPTSREDRRQAGLRSAEEETLKKQIEGLQRQQTLLGRRQDELCLRSPIDGRVLTWDAEPLLQSRPVTRGQTLLTVADLDGPWQLELEISDDRIADVTAARRSRQEPLAVRFILATSPELRYTGRLERVAPATDVRSEQGPSASAIVIPDDQQVMRTLRPGATVVAKIDCGNHSLLYVMFHGLIRVVRSRVLF